MADMDGFKEASAYGLDQPQKNKSFFLKGNENRGWGIKNRLSRIFNPKTGNTVMLACDHGFIMGPTSGLERVDLSINPLIEYADCLMCTRGILRSVIPPTMSKPVCLRSDGGTTILTDLNLNRVYDVEDVIRMNVSAMAVMVSCGDKASEQITTHNLVHTVDMGEKYGIPVLGVTAVGKDMARDARYFRLATRVCAENGAHFVKTYFTDEGFETVVAQCPVPIVIAGGKVGYAGERFQKPGIVTFYRFYPGLLEHDLRQPDVIRFFVPAPGKIPAVFFIPGQQNSRKKG